MRTTIDLDPEIHEIARRRAFEERRSIGDVIDGLAQMGLEAKGSSSADLAALRDRDTKRWAPLVKAIGFTAES